MKMYIQIQCAAKALDQGHGARFRQRLCEGWLACKQKTKRERKTQHPLTHGLMRQDFIHQQSSTIRHATCPTTGAESPPFTAERDQFFIMAGFTPDPEKTVLQHSAFQ